MRRLYDKNEITFAVLWIVIYCFLTIPVRGNFGDNSIWMLVVLMLVAIGITVFVRKNKLENKYGLDHWPKDQKRYLYFIPMWIIATGNLWDGITLNYQGISLLYAVLSMTLIGYIEEMLFRGFLFTALLEKDGPKMAIIISSVTFGMGHIVNILAGQANLETIIQMIFAVSWGFIFTMVYYKSGSLLPCILAHAMVDVFSLFGVDSADGDYIYVITTIVVAVIYCSYLAKIERAKK